MKKLRQYLVMGTVMTLAMAGSAYAGTGGTEFDSIWTTVKDWTQGTLGRIIAGSMILVGIIAGVIRQSLMAFAVGIGGGVGLYNSPTIIENIMTAAQVGAAEGAAQAAEIANGLGLL